MNNPQKYPVLYYDIDNEDRDKTMETLNSIAEFYKKENIPFVFLPKHYTELEYLTKEEAIKLLNEVIEEVKKWE